MKNNYISYEKITSILFAYSLLNFLTPYYVWTNLGKFFFMAIPLFLYVIVFIYRLKINIKRCFLANGIIIMLLYFYLFVFWDVFALHRLFFFILSALFFIFSISVKNSYIILFWKYFICIFSLALVPGMFVYFLRFFINIPFKEIEALNIMKSYNYLTFAGSLFPNVSGALSLRFHGIFDEPGALGTYAALILGFDQFRNRIPCFIILISGIMSFSIAFYILLFFCIIFIFKNKKTWIALLLMVAFAVYPIKELRTMVFDRLVVTEEGLSGDNRDQEQFKQEFTKFINKKENIIFGKGYKSSNLVGAIGGSSLRMFIYEYGVFGLLLILLVYLVLFIKNRTKNNFYMLIAFLLSLYQRPIVYTWGFLLIFYLGTSLDYIYSNYTNFPLATCTVRKLIACNLAKYSE